MNDKRNLLMAFCRFTDLLVEAALRVAMVLQAVFMLMLAVQIVLRFFFNSPIFGIEEGVTGLVVWFAALGAVVVTRQNGHAQVEYFLKFFPAKFRKFLSAATYMLGVWLSYLMIIGGHKQFLVQSRAMPAGGLPFSKAYYYALPIMVMGVLMALVCLGQVIRILFEREGVREGGDII